VEERDELAGDELRRRSGIGGRLLVAAADWGRSETASEIRLSVVAGNSVAEHFYEREGFTTRARVLARPIAE
jgi:GNAT superfamily N-acetyltransferase